MVMNFTQSDSDASVTPPSAMLFNANGTMNRVNAQMVVDAAMQGNKSMQFRLFPDGGAGYALSLSQRNWRIINVTPTRIEFMAVTAYRTGQFNDTPSFNYSTSLVRTNLINHFYAGVPVAIRNNLVAHGTTDNFAVSGDLIWVPSVNELRGVPAELRSAPIDTWTRTQSGAVGANMLAAITSLASMHQGAMDLNTGSTNSIGIRPVVAINFFYVI